MMAVTRPAGAMPEIFLRISLVLPLLSFPFKGMERETVVWRGGGRMRRKEEEPEGEREGLACSSDA